jgi:polyribonucleotide nucleotidyltransferase
MQAKRYALEIGGREMVAEFSDLAEQAHGSVMLRYGETVVLATAVMSARVREDIDYVPLSVSYEERYYAAGAILGGAHGRREDGQSESAVISGRAVDRAIRPLFDAHERREAQVVVTVLALGEDDPQHVAVNAASLALATSPIPWGGPVAAVRIGSGLSINPTYKEREGTGLDLLACGRGGAITMIEAGAGEASEEEVAAGLARAAQEHAAILAWQEGIIREIGKPKAAVQPQETPEALAGLYASGFASRMEAAVFCGAPGNGALRALKDEWLKRAGESAELSGAKGAAKRFFEDKVDEEIRRGTVEGGKRADNRAMDELRPLYARAGGVSPLLHGSGIFYRGGTHVFTALTLDRPDKARALDSMEKHGTTQRFIHHYNFPPYSVGETGRMGANRRATGHGRLAEKALEAVLPDAEAFPYAIRLVSECLSSNGSTSMASVCASALALMDGGVPIKAPVAGIAMGLMLGKDYAPGNSAYKVLTDIQGPEDEFGDMDFKVAGTRAGITAMQMDTKLEGVALPILAEALAGAKAARMKILGVMEKEIAQPRAQISPRVAK